MGIRSISSPSIPATPSPRASRPAPTASTGTPEPPQKEGTEPVTPPKEGTGQGTSPAGCAQSEMGFWGSQLPPWSNRGRLWPSLPAPGWCLGLFGVGKPAWPRPQRHSSASQRARAGPVPLPSILKDLGFAVGAGSPICEPSLTLNQQPPVAGGPRTQVLRPL